MKTKKLMMYSPGRPYIVVAPVVTSWAVAGQRMVFFHMFLQARVTLEAFPIVAHEGEAQLCKNYNINYPSLFILYCKTLKLALFWREMGFHFNPNHGVIVNHEFLMVFVFALY